MKIYILMALVSAIAALSHLPNARHANGRSAQTLANGSSAPAAQHRFGFRRRMTGAVV